LGQSVHIHGRSLTLLVGRHRLQQLERLGEINLNRLLRRLVVQTFDLGELLVGRKQSEFH
jgi:hypothetical protein